MRTIEEGMRMTIMSPGRLATTLPYSCIGLVDSRAFMYDTHLL